MTSCKHTEQINSLEAGKSAAIVGGCVNYCTGPGFFHDKVDRERECQTFWNGSDGSKFTILGYNDVAFVRPGTYEFVGYKSFNSRYKKPSPDALSVFNKITIKGGEVKYIGTLNVNSRKSTLLLDSVKFIQHPKEAEAYLKNTYPDLANKMQALHITLSPEAKKVKEMMSKNKK